LRDDERVDQAAKQVTVTQHCALVESEGGSDERGVNEIPLRSLRQS